MKRILVVEDDANIAKLQSMILSDDYFVETVFYGQEALERIKTNKPDLVLLDLMMPGMNGLDVCKRIKADSNLKDIKVVMVTAKSDIKDEQKGLDLGADDYICKPFEPEELLHVVKQQF